MNQHTPSARRLAPPRTFSPRFFLNRHPDAKTGIPKSEHQDVPCVQVRGDRFIITAWPHEETRLDYALGTTPISQVEYLFTLYSIPGQ